MKGNKAWLPVILTAILFISGCSYRKGESYRYVQSQDTVNYIIHSTGKGNKILKKIDKLRLIHQARKDEYQVVFVSDSLDVVDRKSILLFRTELPDVENDMLTKGFMGAFGTKEVVTYVVVTFTDMETCFIKVSSPD